MQHVYVFVLCNIWFCVLVTEIRVKPSNVALSDVIVSDSEYIVVVNFNISALSEECHLLGNITYESNFDLGLAQLSSAYNNFNMEVESFMYLSSDLEVNVIRKRGLFDIGDKVIKAMFGTATSTDLETLNQHLEKVYSKSKSIALDVANN
ncbi:hypothetical protein PR048_012753, partial [Dryococelus australis]